MLQKINNPLESCQLKFSNEKEGSFEGYASVFNGVDSYRDTILPGAFKETISEKRIIPMFINHDAYSIPVGQYTNLKEDEKGLLVKAQIDMNHHLGPSLYSALKNKSMDAMSIGFRIRKGGAYEDEETSTRKITNIDLKEISVVNFPADKEARVSVVKSEIQDLNTLKDFEYFLRDSGSFTKSSATAFVSRLKHVVQRDVEDMDEITKQLVYQKNTKSLIEMINRL